MPSGAHTIHTRVPRDYPWSPCPLHLCAPGATFIGGPAQPSGILETCHSDGTDGTHLGLPSAAARRRTHRGNSCSQRPSTEKMQTPPKCQRREVPPACCSPREKGWRQSLSDIPCVARFKGTASFPCTAQLRKLQKFRGRAVVL